MKYRMWVAIVAVALAIGLASRVSWAQRTSNLPSGQAGTFETISATANTSSLGTLGPGSILYGFSLTATAANATCVLYDSATIGAGSATQGVFIDEMAEATANETDDRLWPAPYRLVTDLSVGVANGVCIIYLDVQ